MLIVFLMLIFSLAIVLALAVVLSQKRAIKQAQAMIDTGTIDKKRARKILRTLSTCQTNEGKRLYSKLADLVDAT